MRQTPIARCTFFALAITSLALAVGGATAQLRTEGETAQNRPYVSGGASIEDVEALEQQRNDYRLWLVTAASGSGAWLAGAQTVVRDGRGNVVLDTVLGGPYLMVDLAPGRYTIDVTHEGQRRTQTVSVGSTGTRQVVMYFDSPAEVSPEMPDRSIAPPEGAAPSAAPSPR
jgi:hypothetical protein